MSIGGSTFLGVASAVYNQAGGAAMALASAEFLGAEVFPLVEFYAEEVPERGKDFKNLLSGYRTHLEDKNSKNAKEAQKNMAALLSQTESNVWKNIIGRLENTGWATQGGLFATPTAEQTLKRYGIEPTPFNLQLYKLGLDIEGRKIAFDLDGTLIDYADEKTETEGEYRTTVQIKAGAEALVLGLARHNELLLYTARDAAQVAAIFAHSFAFRESFSDAFTLENWIEVMTEIISKGLEHPGELAPFEQKVLELFKIYRRVPMSLTHLKHPELARRQDKLDFEVIIDDSPGLGELLRFLESDVKQIYPRPRKHYASAAEILSIADDELFRVVEGLKYLDSMRAICIASVTSLESEPLRRFIVSIHDSSYLEPKMQHLESLRQRWVAQGGG